MSEFRVVRLTVQELGAASFAIQDALDNDVQDENQRAMLMSIQDRMALALVDD